LRIPVSDVSASADWYSEVFGLSVLLVEEEQNRVVGAVLSGPERPSLGVHLDPARARALAGFSLVELAVASREALSKWDSWLEEIGVTHTGVVEGPLGWYIDVPDPDGLIVQLHTPEHPSVEES